MYYILIYMCVCIYIYQYRYYIPGKNTYTHINMYIFPPHANLEW